MEAVSECNATSCPENEYCTANKLCDCNSGFIRNPATNTCQSLKPCITGHVYSTDKKFCIFNSASPQNYHDTEYLCDTFKGNMLNEEDFKIYETNETFWISDSTGGCSLIHDSTTREHLCSSKYYKDQEIKAVCKMRQKQFDSSVELEQNGTHLIGQISGIDIQRKIQFQEVYVLVNEEMLVMQLDYNTTDQDFEILKNFINRAENFDTVSILTSMEFEYNGLDLDLQKIFYSFPLTTNLTRHQAKVYTTEKPYPVSYGECQQHQQLLCTSSNTTLIFYAEKFCYCWNCELFVNCIDNVSRRKRSATNSNILGCFIKNKRFYCQKRDKISSVELENQIANDFEVYYSFDSTNLAKEGLHSQSRWRKIDGGVPAKWPSAHNVKSRSFVQMSKNTKLTSIINEFSAESFQYLFVSLWVKIDTFPTGSCEENIVNLLGASYLDENCAGYYLCLENETLSIKFSNDGQIFSASSEIQLNLWNHISIRYENRTLLLATNFLNSVASHSNGTQVSNTTCLPYLEFHARKIDLAFDDFYSTSIKNDANEVMLFGNARNRLVYNFDYICRSVGTKVDNTCSINNFTSLSNEVSIFGKIFLTDVCNQEADENLITHLPLNIKLVKNCTTIQIFFEEDMVADELINITEYFSISIFLTINENSELSLIINSVHIHQSVTFENFSDVLEFSNSLQLDSLFISHSKLQVTEMLQYVFPSEIILDIPILREKMSRNLYPSLQNETELLYEQASGKSVKGLTYSSLKLNQVSEFEISEEGAFFPALNSLMNGNESFSLSFAMAVNMSIDNFIYNIISIQRDSSNIYVKPGLRVYLQNGKLRVIFLTDTLIYQVAFEIMSTDWMEIAVFYDRKSLKIVVNEIYDDSLQDTGNSYSGVTSNGNFVVKLGDEFDDGEILLDKIKLSSGFLLKSSNFPHANVFL